MRLFKPKIQSKLTLAFLVMGLVPMLLSTFIVVRLNARREDREIRIKLENASQEFSKVLKYYQDQAVIEVKNHARSPQFRADLPALERLTSPRVRRPPGMGKPTIIWEPGRMEGMNYQLEGGRGYRNRPPRPGLSLKGPDRLGHPAHLERRQGRREPYRGLSFREDFY